MAVGLTEMHRTKSGEFVLFLCVFLQEFRQSDPFFANFREIDVFTVMLARLLMLVLLLEALLFLVSRLSAVCVCEVPIVSAAVA
jgi:hypothetical protein